jgi:hypothetical protein
VIIGIYCLVFYRHPFPTSSKDWAMLRKKINKIDVEFYNSIEEMPHVRYMKFNKELIRANEVGTGTIDLIKRVNRAIGYLKADQHENAQKEMLNLKLNINYIEHEIDPKSFALACVVKSIDGELCDDITTDGLKLVIDKLQKAGITKKDVDKNVDDIKKKLSWKYLCSIPVNLAMKVYHSIKRSLTN